MPELPATTPFRIASFSMRSAGSDGRMPYLLRSILTNVSAAGFESGLVAPFLYAADKNGWIRAKTA
jgi:hypothetical protein